MHARAHTHTHTHTIIKSITVDDTFFSMIDVSTNLTYD